MMDSFTLMELYRDGLGAFIPTDTAVLAIGKTINYTETNIGSKKKEKSMKLIQVIGLIIIGNNPFKNKTTFLFPRTVLLSNHFE